MIGHIHARDAPIDVPELTWLQLPASWPLASERLDIDLLVESLRLANVWKTSQIRRYATCVLLVWNDHRYHFSKEIQNSIFCAESRSEVWMLNIVMFFQTLKLNIIMYPITLLC